MTETFILPSRLMVVDTAKEPLREDIVFPFAFDEVYCRKAGQGLIPAVIHIWRHRRAFVMGLRDRKLPYAEEAMNWLESIGYAVTVRNSGGAAVPLDEGVINLSIILPNPQGRIDFRNDFATMYSVISNTLYQFCSVEKGEIIGSYCPGDFDLSIGGKKFCGIAQRRQTKAYAIQAFVIVEGKGEERGELVKEFYWRASRGIQGIQYPRVEPRVMASLSELIQFPSSDTFLESLHHYLSRAQEVTQFTHYPQESMEEVLQTVEQLKARYEKR